MADQQLASRGLRDARVLDAMRTLPRHRFVADVNQDRAYADCALPTRDGQTISQPYMVARMTQLLELQPGMSVLEVGTGSGYQTALLVMLGGVVTTIESSQVLADAARQTLAGLELAEQVDFVVGDGTLGWPAGAPYDRILVTAGAPHLPRAFREQLAPAGRIVIPIGPADSQTLMVYHEVDGRLSETRDITCRFVPLVGADGWAGGW